MKKKSYLVTGGGGFLGSSLVKRLIREGYRVRVLDNLSRGSMRRLKEAAGRFDFIQGDIRDTRIVDKAAKNTDGVCHLAFVNGTEFFYKKPELVLDVGVRGMLNVLDACLKHRVKELILASSSEVYQKPPVIPTDETVPLSIPDPLNPRYSYGAGKIISEILAINYARKHFDRMVIFRPHNVYGPDMGSEHVIPQFALRMKELKRKNGRCLDFPIQGTGKETRAFIYIDDFTEGLMKLIRRGAHMGIYHIGTTEERTIEEVARAVAEYFGVSIKLVPGALAPGSTPRRCPDTRKLAALGFRPATAFKDGVFRTCEWYDKNA